MSGMTKERWQWLWDGNNGAVQPSVTTNEMLDTIRFEQIRNEELQRKIDELMLEYCPNDMTDEQIENWVNHQVPITSKELDELMKVLGDIDGRDK